MSCTKSAAERRYLGRSLFTMSVYVLAVWCVAWTFHHHHPQGAVVYLLALAPAPPILAAIAILGLYITEEKDEFLRAVLVQSSLWATAVVLAFTTFWGLLQTYSPTVDLHIHAPMYWVFVVWYVTFGLSQPLVQLRYR